MVYYYCFVIAGVGDIMFNFSITPDVNELLDILWRKKLPKRVHHIELFHDFEIIQQIFNYYELNNDLKINDPAYSMKIRIAVNEFLGSDIFRMPVSDDEFFKFELNLTADTSSKTTNRGDRGWVNEQKGPIQNWSDFEKFPWPKLKNIDFSRLEWMEKNLPENMGCFDLTASILELLTWLMGYETLCMKIFDDSELIDAICEKVGKFYEGYTRCLCDFDCMPIIWGSDDMGFRSSTMVSPDFLRQKIFPWHKICAEIAHDSKKPYLIHSCGKLDEIMPDLINDIKIDAKHSFEDTILPVTEAFEQYSDDIAILGGIDIDFLCRRDEKSIRKRVRETLEICMQKEGYCLGTGNTVANYIPLNNYLAMLDEGFKYTV